jgi:hypothetical protein|tara:strand:- start:455 stop:691 length:237 start_codon:yes stop_codon:yes gene_type:complete
MIHIFLLVVYLGVGEDRRLISNDMYFYDINRCNYFAKQVSKRYGNYRYMDFIDPRDRVTSYCKPIYTNPEALGIKVYE